MRPIIINADDYAMDESTDAAILALAEKGSISAASVMVLSPRWPEAARASKDAAAISWGLHLDLTSSFANPGALAPALPALMARAQARLLNPEVLRKVIGRQMVLFEQHRRAAPDFIDGHQHVHQLPIVREVLLALMEEHYGSGARHIGLRICASRRWRGMKAAIIGGSGASALSKLAAQRGHPVNSDFAGVYNFDPRANLGVLWEGWAKTADGPLPLIMCHVAAEAGSSKHDPIRAARIREYAWLSSAEFAALRKRLQISPQRWPRALGESR